MLLLWRKLRNSTSKHLFPFSTKKTRKRSPPLMKAFGTRKLAEPFPPKKPASSCPSGLPPPLHSKGTKRSRRNHRPRSQGWRGRSSCNTRQIPRPAGETRGFGMTPFGAGGHFPQAAPLLDVLHHLYFRSEAELGKDFSVRNSLPAALLEPRLGLGDGLAFFFAFRLVVDGRVRNGAGNGIEQTFKHADCCRDLAWGQSIDEFVGVLLVCGHRSLPREFYSRLSKTPLGLELKKIQCSHLKLAEIPFVARGDV